MEPAPFRCNVKSLMRIVLFLIPIPALAQNGAQDGEWRFYGGDAGGTKYAPLDQISAKNFNDLRVAWEWTAVNSGERPDYNYEVTPIMIGGVLYTSTGANEVAAVDAKTGQTLWVYSPGLNPARSRRTSSGRGVAYWTDGDEARIFSTLGGELVALDAATGQVFPGFGKGGAVNLAISSQPSAIGSENEPTRASSTSPPIVVGDVVIVQVVPSRGRAGKTSPGHVRGYDPRTGERLWIFHVIPQHEEFGVETWEDDSWRYTGNAGVWTLLSADQELGYVYLPTEASTNDWYGGRRPGDNLFAESLVCLDAKTGERVWHFQLIHHGLWDYDNPAPPNLIDITVDGERIKAIAQVTKQGFCYVFNRETGEPIWPIEERAVPQSDVPGERSSTSQPFPTKPAPFEPQEFTLDRIIDFTPGIRAEALQIVMNYQRGPLYTPPSVLEPGGTKGTLALPGYGGGANWPGAAVDPEEGIIFIPSATVPIVMALEKGDPDRTDFAYTRTGDIYPPLVRGLPLIKPPWGRITAIDLNTGEHLWMVPNGAAPEAVRNHPELQDLGLDFSKMGQNGRPGALVTKTLLIVGEGGGLRGGASRPIRAGGPMFRAYDKRTGEVVGEIELPANTTGVPMSYMIERKQYIVVAIGAREHPAQLIALSLP